VSNRSVGPFEGGNWTGHFQLREIGPFGRTVSVLTLSPRQYTLFTHKFSFSFSDYNGDTYPDFALGQYAGSDNNQYQIFSVERDGLRELPISSRVVFGPPNAGYSPRFTKVGPKAFASVTYDNSRASWVTETMAWTDGAFVERSHATSAVPATPACTAAQLSATDSGNQDGGTQVQATIKIVNVGSASCMLAGIPTAMSLLGGTTTLASRTVGTPANIVLQSQVLRPEAANAAYLVVWWGNWCGSRSEPVDLRFVLPGNAGALRSPYNTYGGHAFVPECLQPGAPSTLQVSAAYLGEQ